MNRIRQFYNDNKEYARDDLRIKSIVKSYKEYNNSSLYPSRYSALQIIKYLTLINNEQLQNEFGVYDGYGMEEFVNNITENGAMSVN